MNFITVFEQSGIIQVTQMYIHTQRNHGNPSPITFLTIISTHSTNKSYQILHFTLWFVLGLIGFGISGMKNQISTHSTLIKEEEQESV